MQIHICSHAMNLAKCRWDISQRTLLCVFPGYRSFLKLCVMCVVRNCYISLISDPILPSALSIETKHELLKQCHPGGNINNAVDLSMATLLSLFFDSFGYHHQPASEPGCKCSKGSSAINSRLFIIGLHSSLNHRIGFSKSFTSIMQTGFLRALPWLENLTHTHADTLFD